VVQIYECRPSIEDDRPQIDFEDFENSINDWLLIGEVINGTKPIGDFPMVSVTVRDPDATNWDCYRDGGIRGLFSERFVEAIGRSSFIGLTLLPAMLNGIPYYFLRCDQPIDCFHRSKASFETFRSDPMAIKRITHFAFQENLVPTNGCFCIPETVALLLTETVVERLNAAKLKGIHIIAAP